MKPRKNAASKRSRSTTARPRAAVRKARRTFGEWSKLVAVVWVLQLAVLIYFLLTQTWSTYWFCRDLYRPGYTLFAWIGKGLLPGGCFNLFSQTGVLVSFSAAALLYAAAGVSGVGMIRQMVRKT